MTEAENKAIAAAFAGVMDPVVVNIGAYRGEDDAVFRELAGEGFLRHIMVEPDAENCEAIRAGGNVPGCALLEAAVGARNEVRTFWRSRDRRNGVRGSGSVLEPHLHRQHFPEIEFEAAGTRCFTLDYLFETFALPRIDLLWCDAQGAEREIIEGGRNALERTRYFFLEADSIEFYRGQATKAELLAMLPEWQLVEDFGFNIFLKNPWSR